MGSFGDFLKAYSPPFLRGAWGDARSEVLGAELDDLVDQAKQAVKARFPATAPADALPPLGADRLILRGPGESDGSYVARLVAWRSTWAWAGTAKGLLQYALAPASYTNAAVIENRDWSPAPPDGDTASWARFWVVIAQPHGWVDDGLWADDSDWGESGTPGWWGSSATLDDVTRVQQLIARWKPAHATCAGIFIVFGTTTQLWGSPGTWSDPGTWGSGTHAILWPS